MKALFVSTNLLHYRRVHDDQLLARQPWKLVLLLGHCAWLSVLESCRQPSPVALVPCRSLHRGYCLFAMFSQLCDLLRGFIGWIEHTEKLVKVLEFKN